MNNNRHRVRGRTLQVMQVNVGKGGATHDIALGFAHESHFDLVLVQEPWFGQDRSTKKHPNYRCYTPIEDWEQRPRVLTYLRKSPQLQGAQVQGSWGSNRDILALQVQAWNCHIQIINVYNAPPGSLDPGQGVQSIISHVTSLL